MSLPTRELHLPTPLATRQAADFENFLSYSMRPPYGDIDDRVRYISLRMGLRPVIWTVYNGQTFGEFSFPCLREDLVLN